MVVLTKVWLTQLWVNDFSLNRTFAREPMFHACNPTQITISLEFYLYHWDLK